MEGTAAPHLKRYLLPAVVVHRALRLRVGVKGLGLEFRDKDFGFRV